MSYNTPRRWFEYLALQPLPWPSLVIASPPLKILVLRLEEARRPLIPQARTVAYIKRRASAQLTLHFPYLRVSLLSCISLAWIGSGSGSKSMPLDSVSYNLGGTELMSVSPIMFETGHRCCSAYASLTHTSPFHLPIDALYGSDVLTHHGGYSCGLLLRSSVCQAKKSVCTVVQLISPT